MNFIPFSHPPPPPPTTIPQTLSLSFSLYNGLRPLQSKVLRNKFGHKEEAVTQKRRKLQSDWFCNTYCSSSRDTVLFSRCLFNDAVSIYDDTASKAVIFKSLYQKYEKGGKCVTWRKIRYLPCIILIGGDPVTGIRIFWNWCWRNSKQRYRTNSTLSLCAGQLRPYRSSLYSGGAWYESLLQQTLLRRTFSMFSSFPPDNSSFCITLLKIQKKKLHLSERM